VLFLTLLDKIAKRFFQKIYLLSKVSNIAYF